MVRDLNLSEIKRLETEKGERIPTLEEALDFLDKKVKILIELKETGFENTVVQLIRIKGLENSVIVVSFLEDALRKIRELDGTVETGLIYARHKNPIQAALELKADYLLPLYRFTHTTDVEKAHRQGLKVLVWTIDNPEELKEYVKKGVDGIASNKPDILKTE